jgi:hypothetical protein
MAATADDALWDAALSAASVAAAVDPTLADLLPPPQAAPTPRRGVPVWTTVKTDSERHLERLEARLARVQAASARGGLGRGRGRGAVPTRAPVRPLTEVELLALDDDGAGGGWRVREDDGDDVAMLARLAEARGYRPAGQADEVDDDDDDAAPARITRYAALLAGVRGRTSSSSSSGSNSGDDDGGGGGRPSEGASQAADAAWTPEWPPLHGTDAAVQPPAQPPAPL